MRIEVWDDDLLDPDDRMYVAPNDGIVNIEYNVVTGKWDGDTENHVCSGEDGTIYLAIFPHWTELSLLASPIEVLPYESTTLSGYLTTDWPGLTSDLVNILLKYYNLDGKTIELRDVTDNVYIGTATTGSDGSFSKTYTLADDASFGPHVIEARFEGDDDWAGSSATTDTAFFVVPEVPFGTVMAFLRMFIALGGFLGFKRFRTKFRLQ